MITGNSPLLLNGLHISIIPTQVRPARTVCGLGLLNQTTARVHYLMIPTSLKNYVAIVASLFMYIAFILISAVGTILAVQSLSDSTKYKYRYLTLRRLGINDKSLFKTIRKQLLILFCVPAISAILCSFVMMSSLNNVYQQILGDKHLYLMYFGLNLIIFFLIYSIYWIATYIGFKRNINEES